MSIVKTAAAIWRKYVIDGVPGSGANQPAKEDIIPWGTLLETLTNGSAAGWAYQTLAALNADLAHAANTAAVVYGDSTAANNGQYTKVGPSGTGSWTRVGDLPNALVRITVTGGTGDAIIATAPETPTLPGAKLYLMTPTANNTTTTSIALNGGSPVAIKNAFGLDLAASTLINASQVLMAWSVDHYQLLISVAPDASTILASAIAAQNAAASSATAAASSASALANQVHQYDTRALAAAATIPTGVQAIKITRFAAGYPLDYATYIPGTNTGPMNFAEAGGHYWQLDLTVPVLRAAWFGVKADGTADDTSALQAAITAAAGREVALPSGTIVLTSQVNYITAVNFTSGLRLRGAGMRKTIIDNRVANNSCIYTAGGTFLFQLGGYIKDFTIMTTTSPIASHGIEQLAVYQFDIENIYITGLSGDGIRVTASLGDPDASNNLRYSGCWIENCLRGINCNFAASAVQTSYMRVENCFFATNGVGWRCIGLSHSLINSTFVTHTTYGLQIVDNGVSNAQFTSMQAGFENNAQAIQINALQGGTFIQTELAGSNAFAVSTIAVAIDTSAGIEFSGTRVRISSTPHTLWTLGAGAVSNKIGNSFYQSYDAAGQVRYSQNAIAYGNRLDDSTDSIVFGHSNGVTSIACVNGANQNLTIPIDGAAYSIGSGTSGAYSVGGFTNGWSGRRLTLLNNSGQVLTLLYEAAGSTAANRIATESGANITVNNLATFSMLYLADSRWHYLGKG